MRPVVLGVFLLLQAMKGEGEPRLFLTPSLGNSNVQETCKITSSAFAQPNVQMYSAFLTVNATYNAHLFFWFVKAVQDYDTAPLVLWLGGGDGVGEPATLGLLTEVGPYMVDRTLVPTFNSYHWSKDHSMLFIDAPVGTGFSYAEDPLGASETVNDVVEHLYEALQQFLQIFPEMQNKPFYIAAQGFAAQFATGLGQALHQRKSTASRSVEFKGLLLGSANLVPYETFDNSQYLFYTGLIDLNTYNNYLTREQGIETLYRANDFSGAQDAYDQYQNDVKTATGYESLHNIVKLTDAEDGYFWSYMAQEAVRDALHVGDATISNGQDARNKMKAVLFKPYLQGIEFLLGLNYSVLFYSGNLDMQFPYRGSGVEQYTVIQFPSREQYLEASRGYWNDGTVSEAYGQIGGSLYELVIRNAGRRVGREKRILAAEMVTRFTRDTLRERFEYM